MKTRNSIVINANSNWFSLIGLKECIAYKDLIGLFVKRNFKALYKQTILGPAWAVLQPLMTTVVFTVIFGQIARLPTDQMPPFLFYMCGNIAWGFFSSSLVAISSTFISNAQIFGKVYFPRLAVPISTILTNLITFVIQFLFFIVISMFYIFQPNSVIHPNNWMFMLPVILVHMAILSMGLGTIISALTSKYRDLQMLVGFCVSLWMYLTPITYSNSIIPEKLKGIYMLNPMTPIIEMLRYAFLGSGSVNMLYYLISFLISCIILSFGVIIFGKTEKTFMDTI